MEDSGNAASERAYRNCAVNFRRPLRVLIKLDPPPMIPVSLTGAGIVDRCKQASAVLHKKDKVVSACGM